MRTQIILILALVAVWPVFAPAGRAAPASQTPGASAAATQSPAASKSATMNPVTGPNTVQTSALAGVLLANHIQLGGSELQLNGAGIKKHLWLFKQYVAALYLEKRSRNPALAVVAAGPKQLLIHWLTSRSKSDLLSAWDAAIRANTPEQRSSEVQKDLKQFNGMLVSVKKRDEYRFDYVPGQGTVVHLNQTVKGTIPGETFYQALLRAWLGTEPISDHLKKQLLGLRG